MATPEAPRGTTGGSRVGLGSLVPQRLSCASYARLVAVLALVLPHAPIPRSQDFHRHGGVIHTPKSASGVVPPAPPSAWLRHAIDLRSMGAKTPQLSPPPQGARR